MNNIELELRAEIPHDDSEPLLRLLKKNYPLVSHSRRLTMMFIGRLNHSNIDIRTRIDSAGKSELVMKKGQFHSHDRIEISQQIDRGQMLGLVSIFSQFGLTSKVTERENFLFKLGNSVNLVLVRAGKISYVEIEKMSNNKNLDSNKKKLIEILSKYDLKPMNGEEFDELCKRLTKYSDWPFNGTVADFKKLKNLISQY